MLGNFEDFWKLYPNKKSKGYARVAYAKAMKITTHNEIMEWLRKYNNHLSLKWESKYVKHPATWLNGECREDSYVVKASVVPKKEEVEEIPVMTVEERMAARSKLLQMKNTLFTKAN